MAKKKHQKKIGLNLFLVVLNKINNGNKYVIYYYALFI